MTSSSNVPAKGVELIAEVAGGRCDRPSLPLSTRESSVLPRMQREAVEKLASLMDS